MLVVMRLSDESLLVRFVVERDLADDARIKPILGLPAHQE